MICRDPIVPRGDALNLKLLAKKWKEMFGTHIVNGVEVFNRVDIGADICEKSDTTKLFELFGFDSGAIDELCQTYNDSRDSVDALFYEPSKKLSSTRTHWGKHKEIIEELLARTEATTVYWQYMNEKSDETEEIDNHPYWEYFYNEDLNVDDFGENLDPIDTRDTMDDESNELYITRTSANAFKYAYLFATDDDGIEVDLDVRILNLLKVFVWGSQRRLEPNFEDAMRYTTTLDDTKFVYERTYSMPIIDIMDDWDNLYEKFTSTGTEDDKRVVYLRNEPLELSDSTIISTWYMLSNILEDRYVETEILVVDGDNWYVSYEGLRNASMADYEMVMPMVMQLGYVGTSNGIIQDLMAGLLQGIMTVVELVVDVFHTYTPAGWITLQVEIQVEKYLGITVEEQQFIQARILTALFVSYITGGGEIGALTEGASYAQQAVFAMDMGSTVLNAHSGYQLMDSTSQAEELMKEIAKEKEELGNRKIKLDGRYPSLRRQRIPIYDKLDRNKIRKDRTYGCRFIKL